MSVHPDPGLVDKQIAERVAITQSRYARARRWVIKPSLVLGPGAPGVVLILVRPDADDAASRIRCGAGGGRAGPAGCAGR